MDVYHSHPLANEQIQNIMSTTTTNSDTENYLANSHLTFLQENYVERVLFCV